MPLNVHKFNCRGLHCAAVQETVQVRGSPAECKMLLLDRPLLPLYCRCSIFTSAALVLKPYLCTYILFRMGSKCSRGQEASPRPSSVGRPGKRLARQAGIDEKEEVPPLRLPWLPFINSKSASRPSSCHSQNPRASTAVMRLTVPSAVPTPRSLAPHPHQLARPPALRRGRCPLTRGLILTWRRVSLNCHLG